MLLVHVATLSVSTEHCLDKKRRLSAPIPFPGGDWECVRSHSLSLKLNNVHGYVSELICLSVISTFPGFGVPFQRYVWILL